MRNSVSNYAPGLSGSESGSSYSRKIILHSSSLLQVMRKQCPRSFQAVHTASKLLGHSFAISYGNGGDTRDLDYNQAKSYGKFKKNLDWKDTLRIFT